MTDQMRYSRLIGWYTTYLHDSSNGRPLYKCAQVDPGTQAVVQYGLRCARYGYASVWLGIWFSRRGLRAVAREPNTCAFWRTGKLLD